MKRFVFLIQGSAAEPYKVIFDVEGKDVKASCGCPHGIYNRGFCKHKRRLLAGDATGLVGDNQDDIERLSASITNRKLIKTSAALEDIENAITEAQNERKRLRKLIGGMLAGD